MFESRRGFDGNRVMLGDSLPRAGGAGRHDARRSFSPGDEPSRAAPRPLRADPPILMIGHARRVRWSRGGAWTVLGIPALLCVAGVSVLLVSGDSEHLVQPNTTLRDVPDADPPAPIVAATPPETEPVPPAATAPPPASEAAPPDSRTKESAATRPRAQATPVPVDPEPARGFLFVNSRPWGRVLIDGRFIGNTPVLRIPIAPGSHELRVEREGFHPFETIITVDPAAAVRMTEIVLRSLIS